MLLFLYALCPFITRKRKRKGHEKKEKRARKKVRKRIRKEERKAKPAPGPIYAWSGTERTRKRKAIKKGRKEGRKGDGLLFLPFLLIFLLKFFILIIENYSGLF